MLPCIALACGTKTEQGKLESNVNGHASRYRDLCGCKTSIMERSGSPPSRAVPLRPPVVDGFLRLGARGISEGVKGTAEPAARIRSEAVPEPP